ncbi:hypothetical protein ACNQGB_16845, partial [Flavobacterium sp. XS1P32]|uniref:hypothetical protein n=1 Tax=Flavobacterium sp. XS1P32 TaxID=3401726 RepID=UPI003AAE1FC5
VFGRAAPPFLCVASGCSFPLFTASQKKAVHKRAPLPSFTRVKVQNSNFSFQQMINAQGDFHIPK